MREESLEFIRTKEAPAPGAYSQAVLVNTSFVNLLFLSGQTGNDPSLLNERVVDGGIGPQTTQAMKNIASIVQEAGGFVSSLVALDVFLKDTGSAWARCLDRQTFNTAYIAFLAGHGRTQELGNMPARRLLWVPEVPLESPTEETVIEICAIAAIPKNSGYL